MLALANLITAIPTAPLPPNTKWIEVRGSGTPECDGLYCPSKEAAGVSESGTKAEMGYWNGRMAWDRVRLASISCRAKKKHLPRRCRQNKICYITFFSHSQLCTASPLNLYNLLCIRIHHFSQVDGKAKRSPSLSFSNSYQQWRVALLNGHLAYSCPPTSSDLPPTDKTWDM